MFTFDFSIALAGFFSCLLVVVLGHWVIHPLVEKRKFNEKDDGAQSYLIECSFCTHLFYFVEYPRSLNKENALLRKNAFAFRLEGLFLKCEHKSHSAKENEGGKRTSRMVVCPRCQSFLGERSLLSA